MDRFIDGFDGNDSRFCDKRHSLQMEMGLIYKIRRDLSFHLFALHGGNQYDGVLDFICQSGLLDVSNFSTFRARTNLE